ncbi:hypothetical protein OPIT5_01940 [Opitutaceae bacterium TAV5]|nr:hypothetical protein OPIT5_01940 [Opitutaceae bacterium TAV5]
MRIRITSLLLISGVLAFALLPAGVRADAGPVPAVVLPAASAMIWDNHPVDGVGNASLKDALFVGRRTDVKPPRLERSWLSFRLPELPAGTKLRSATLRLRLTDKLGSVSGAVTLYHSVSDNRTRWDGNNYTYENITYKTTGQTVATPETPKGQWIGIDVTALIRSDYGTDTGVRVSSFRLQNDTLTSAGGSYAVFAFGSRGASAPQLVIATGTADP